MFTQFAIQKITVLTFAVMFLIYGITSLGFAHETEDEGPHFEEDSTTRTVEAGAALGTNVGDPVTAHNFGDISPEDGPTVIPLEGADGQIQTVTETVEIRYAFRQSDTNWDWTLFRINKATGQITVGRTLDRTSYSVTVIIESILTVPDEEKPKITRKELDSIDVTIGVIDTTAPTVTGIAFTSTGPYSTGDVIEATVTFSETVNVSIEPEGILFLIIDLETPDDVEIDADGVAWREAVNAMYASGSGTNQLVFRHTVVASDVDPDGLSIPATDLVRFDSTITDLAGNEAVYSTPTVAADLAHTVNVPHFHGSQIRYLLENAEGGTRIDGPVVADGFENVQHTTGEPRDRYVLSGTDAAFFELNSQTGQLTVSTDVTALGEAGTFYSVTVVVQTSKLVDEVVVYFATGSTDVRIEMVSVSSVAVPAEADALPSVSSEERAHIAAALAMDRVIFNELRNATNDTHDWVELRNVSDEAVIFSGWEVRIVTGEGTGIVPVPEGTVLHPGGLLLLMNTNPDAPGMPLSDMFATLLQLGPLDLNAPEMPLSSPRENVVSVVDAGMVLPQTSFTLLLRSREAWEDSVGNYFFGYEIPPTAPPLTTDAAWYRARPNALGYQAEAWVESGYQDGVGYDAGVPAAIALGTPGYPQSSLVGDVDGDGRVNILDLVYVASRFGETDAPEADVNGDGEVNIQDLVMVANRFGSIAAAPSVQTLHASHVQQWVALAKKAVADRATQTSVMAQPAVYKRGIQVLERLLATLVPKSTALLANYPNPFNPETWIPYRLAKGSDVQLRIYDTQGRLVRHLDIGHQPAGLYQTRSQAAYWDGKNEMGESVASGLYFYTLTAADFSATRRMLILK